MKTKTDHPSPHTAVSICGVRIDAVTLPQAIEIALCGRREMCTVVTPNAVMLEHSRKDPELQRILSTAMLSLPDGAGVLMAAKRKGCPLPSRVAGIDFGEGLLAQAAHMHLRVYLLGGREGVAQKAAERLSEKYPGVEFAGTHHGYFEDGSTEEKNTICNIQSAKPDILYVCLGFPRQEKWIERNRSSLSGIRIIAALGGSLDVWAGYIRRAPAIISRMGLEWGWRMAADPHKLSRLPALLRFAVLGKRHL